MKKLFAALLLLAAPSIAYAWDQTPPQPAQACAAQVPFGLPSAKPGMPVECRHAYVLEHDNTAKIPVWVAYTLTPQHAIGCVPRSNAFVADAALPKGQRSELADYAHSGYDIGHLANDADMSWDNTVELESFLLSNMSPQTPAVNRGAWKLLETAARGWVFQKNQTFTVYAGNIYTVGKSKTIGPDNVVVPDELYKIVIDDVTGEYAGWVFPNAGNLGNDLTKLRASVAAIQQATGTTFPLPPKGRELAQNEQWAVDFGALTASKRSICKGSTGD